MYGFKPRHARGKPAQHLADGGLVHSITGMLGMRKRTPEELLAADVKAQARNQEAAAARVAARNQSAQESESQPAKAISSYAGMSAMQRREKAAGLKDGGTVGGFKPGGLIRGPGTGTSDSIQTEKRPGTFIMPADSTQSIGPEALEEMGEVKGREDEGEDQEESGEKVPVNLSNGEFELPPEQVQAIGQAVLTVLRDATHTPVGESKPVAGGFAPNQFFANGGTVFGARGLDGMRAMIPKMEAMGYPQADKRMPAAAPGSRNVADLKALIPTMEKMGYPQALADGGTVQDDEQKRLANQTAMYVVGAQEAAANRPAPAPGVEPATAPAAAPSSAPVAAGFMPGTRAVFNESGKAIGDLAKQGRYGAAAGETARAALAYVPAVADDLIGGAVRTVAPAIADAGKQFLGMGDGAVAANAAQAVAPAPKPQAAPVAAAPTVPSAAATPAPSPAPSQDVQAGPPMSASSSVVRNGNSYSGSNIAGDVTFRNPDGSVRRSGGSVSTLPAGASPMGPAAGFVPGGISTQNMGAADALASREYAASMGRLMASGQIAAPAAGPSMNLSGGTFGFRRDRNIVADERGAQTRFAYGQGTDPASRARSAQLQQAAMQEAGALARAGIQEQGANARETGRNAIAQGELDMKRTAAGFQIRAAQQLENLQNAYATETDATKRAELARQIREIQGKDQPARFKVAAGGQQIDANGVAYKVPDRVFNEQTGEFAGGGQQARTQPYPDGTRLQGKDGKFYVVKNGTPVAE